MEAAKTEKNFTKNNKAKNQSNLHKKKYDISGKYPCKANWIIMKQDGANVIVHNCLSEEDIRLSKREAKLLRKLDGHTNPFSIEGFSHFGMSLMLEKFEDNLLIRQGRRIVNYFTLFIPRKMRTNSLVPKMFNEILMLLCLPVFFIGMKVFFSYEILYLTYDYYIIGIILGIFLGMILHEASHALACLAYGGRFLEAGVMWEGIVPGAYCLLDTSTIDKNHHRLKRVQINLAGVEMNLLLAGSSMLLIRAAASYVFLRSFTGIFFGIAIQNAFLALLNLTFVEGLDGEHAISTLLGKKSIVNYAKKNIRRMFDKEKRRRYFHKNGIEGISTICTSCVIMAFQLLTPMLVIAEIIYVIGVMRS